jgi:hypothetical protein
MDLKKRALILAVPFLLVGLSAILPPSDAAIGVVVRPEISHISTQQITAGYPSSVSVQGTGLSRTTKFSACNHDLLNLRATGISASIQIPPMVPSTCFVIASNGGQKSSQRSLSRIIFVAPGIQQLHRTDAYLVTPEPLTDITCVGLSFCLGIDGANSYVYKGSAPSQWVQYEINSQWRAYENFNWVSSVACASPTWCFTSGLYGVYFFNGSVWQTALDINDTNRDELRSFVFQSLSCIDKGRCFGESYGNTYVLNPSGAFQVIAAKEVSRVECFQGSVCQYTFGRGVYSLSGNSSKWEGSLGGSGLGILISCRGGFGCIAVSDSLPQAQMNYEQYWTYNGNRWVNTRKGTLGGDVRSAIGGVASLSCAPYFCLSVSSDGSFETTNGSLWSSVKARPNNFNIQKLQCYALGRCVYLTEMGEIGFFRR